jgi:hypothetical protein
MFPFIKISKKVRALHLLSISILLLITQSCGTGNKPDKEEQLANKTDNTIEIITKVMDFQTVDTIPSGWNTFHYINKSNETHFFLLDKYPEGKTIEDTEKEVAPPFQNGMDLINEGKTEEGFAEFNKLPAWFFEVVFSGGSGLVSPKSSSLTTIKLEPGYYIMECYVKMANGKFHSTMGMTKQIIVSSEDSGNEPPDATVNITISSNQGIVYDRTIIKGKQTFAVHYKDQIVHENFVGHDVNLVRLDKNTNFDALESWVNWADPKGLITPAPEGYTFLGGVNDMPAGNTGYFEVDLEPGNYAFISEVPNALSKNMLKTFVVSE